MEDTGFTKRIKIVVVVTKAFLSCTINLTVWWQRQLYTEGYFFELIGITI